MPNIFIAYIPADTIAVIENSNEFATLLLPMVTVLGFGAAIILGSLAWYNSKRPMGWEDKKRPEIVPEIRQSENPGLGTPEA